MRGINRHSAESIYQGIRRCLARECELHSPLGGEVECDESYFGSRRRGRAGAARPASARFRLLKRNSKIYLRIVEDVSRKTLQQIIRTKVMLESVIYTNSFRFYYGLVLDGFKHFRINHRECFATSRREHINGIENFWGYAKTKLKSY